MISCQDKPTGNIPTKNNIIVENNLEQLEGHYNVTDDVWQNPNKQYSATIQFQGDKYATFSRIDKDENSLGLGLIDKSGKIIIQPIYSSVQTPFIEGLTLVTDSANKKGLVSIEGMEIVKPQYDDIWLNQEMLDIDNKLIKVEKDDKQGFINLKGDIIIPLKYQSLDLAGDSLIMFFSESQKWGILNYKNEIIVEPLFTSPNIFKNGKTILQQADGENYTVYINGKVEKQ